MSQNSNPKIYIVFNKSHTFRQNILWSTKFLLKRLNKP